MQLFFGLTLFFYLLLLLIFFNVFLFVIKSTCKVDQVANVPQYCKTVNNWFETQTLKIDSPAGTLCQRHMLSFLLFFGKYCREQRNQSRFISESAPPSVLVMIFMKVCFCFQAQLQRSLDSSVSLKPRLFIGRRNRREPPLSMDGVGQGGSQALEQDSGVLDVEDDEEDDEVRKLPPHTETRVVNFNWVVLLRAEISLMRESWTRCTQF